MQMITRSTSLLKTIFPESSIANYQLKGTWVDNIRFEACGVLLQTGSFLESHPEVNSISLKPEYELVYNAATDEHDKRVKLLETFTFTVPLSSGGRFTTAGDNVDKVRDDAADEAEKIRRTSGQSLAEEVIAAGERCAFVINEFERVGYRSVIAGENNVFWDAGELTVNRVQYEESKVGRDLLDFDTLYSLARSQFQDVAYQQSDMANAPAFWNRATVSAIAARLKAGMTPSVCDSNGASPLVAATVLGNRQAVEALLNAGADPSFVDGTGHSAVTAAVAAHNQPLLRRLVEAGGNPDGPPMMPALLVALRTDRPDDMLKTLLAAGADVSAVMPDGRPFNAPLDRFLAPMGDGSLMRRLITELVLAKTSEVAIHDALDGQTRVTAKPMRSKTSLAL